MLISIIPLGKTDSKIRIDLGNWSDNFYTKLHFRNNNGSKISTKSSPTICPAAGRSSTCRTTFCATADSVSGR